MKRKNISTEYKIDIKKSSTESIRLKKARHNL